MESNCTSNSQPEGCILTAQELGGTTRPAAGLFQRMLDRNSMDYRIFYRRFQQGVRALVLARGFEVPPDALLAEFFAARLADGLAAAYDGLLPAALDEFCRPLQPRPERRHPAPPPWGEDSVPADCLFPAPSPWGEDSVPADCLNYIEIPKADAPGEIPTEAAPAVYEMHVFEAGIADECAAAAGEVPEANAEAPAP